MAAQDQRTLYVEADGLQPRGICADDLSLLVVALARGETQEALDASNELRALLADGDVGSTWVIRREWFNPVLDALALAKYRTGAAEVLHQDLIERLGGG